MSMRTYLSIALLSIVLAGCGDDNGSARSSMSGPVATDQRIVYSDGLHNENTEMISLDDRILLIFRGGEEGQIGSSRARINVYATTDGGETLALHTAGNAH